MNLSFNIAEQGEGSYRLLAILRWVMVVIFVSFGMQKFTLQSAQGIAQFISNSPFISWLSVFGLRGEAYVLGVAEFGIAVLLAAGAFSPLLSAIGSLMGVITFAVTWSFFFTTPGVVKWSLSTDPMAWNLAGESCSRTSCCSASASCCCWRRCRGRSSDHAPHSLAPRDQWLSHA